MITAQISFFDRIQPAEIARQMLINQNMRLISWLQGERYYHRLVSQSELLMVAGTQNLFAAIEFSQQPDILQLGQRRWLEQGKGVLQLIDSFAYKQRTGTSESMGMVFNWHTALELKAIKVDNLVAGAVVLELIRQIPFEDGQQFPVCFSDIPIEVNGCGRDVTLTYFLDVTRPATIPIKVAIGRRTIA